MRLPTFPAGESAMMGMNDDLMTIAHLTKAIVLKDDFTKEARLLRAEAC